MKRLLAILMIVAFALGGLGGCAGMKAAEMWQKADPMTKAIFFVETYNSQFNQYISIVAMATGMTGTEVLMMMEENPAELQRRLDASKLSKEARQVLRYKKDLLSKLDKPIDVFVAIAQTGIAPNAEQEQIIMDLLNQLKYKAYMMQ